MTFIFIGGNVVSIEELFIIHPFAYLTGLFAVYLFMKTRNSGPVITISIQFLVWFFSITTCAFYMVSTR